MKKTLSLLFVSILLLTGSSLGAQDLRSSEIDALVQKAMKTFNVPGIAVAVIKDGKVLHSRGYGIRSVNSGAPVDENTLFGIASNTKAFTTAALGILIDEKKLGWDDKVTDIIPEFRLYNAYVTEEFTIRDLITHRSGLGLGAGDLMLWPEGNDFTIDDIIHNLRYLKPVSSFRSKWDYDNLLYIVAGEVVERVSKMSYPEFIEKRIMKPLGMNASAAMYERLKDKSNVTDPHVEIDGKLTVVHRDNGEIYCSAGGIYSNISDLGKWVMMHLGNCSYGDKGQYRLLSEPTHDQLWTINTIMPTGRNSIYNTHFAGYGLGWFINDAKGYKIVWHDGGLAGMVTKVTMVPELNLGVIVLTNQQATSAFNAITYTILDRYFGVSGIDRIALLSGRVSTMTGEAKSITDSVWNLVNVKLSERHGKTDHSSITGIYTDNWFGDISITEKEGKLLFESKRSPALRGELFQLKESVYVVKWDDRSMDADAYVIFSMGITGHASGIKMQPVSPLTDFSYDFQDLDFRFMQ